MSFSIIFWSSLVIAASNPDITVEWFPNDSHPNPAREGKNVYPLTINGIYGGRSVGMRAVLWLPPDVDCNTLTDSRDPGWKVLHLFIDAKYAGSRCQGFNYAHYDVRGGYCQAPDRLHWNVSLPAVRRRKELASVATIWWMAVKMEPLRNTDAHLSLTQTWPIADNPIIPYVVGDGSHEQALLFQYPVFQDCRDMFP